MIPINHGARWTEEQEKWLFNAMKKYTIQHCAEQMGRTVVSIRSRILHLIYQEYKQGMDIEATLFKIPIVDIKEYIYLQELPNRGAEWDGSQDEWLTKYINKKGIDYCAEKMGRSKKELQTRIEYLILNDLDNNNLSLVDIYTKYSSNEEYILSVLESRNNFVKLEDANNLNETGPHYVVISGHTPGIFDNWNSCYKSIYKFGKSKFKKCMTKQDVLEYINNVSVNQKTKNIKKEQEHPSYNQKEIILDESQKKILNEIIETKRNMVILGSAGTGKSTTIKAIIKACKQQNINIGVTATTGCAAILIGGNTIHSFMGIGTAEYSAITLANNILYKKHKLSKLVKLEILLIDEISMMNAELLSKVSNVLSIIRNNPSPFGGVQVILIGDFYQLPPVQGEFCFKSDIWNQMNFSIHQLTKIYRQSDTQFLDILYRAREGKMTDEDMETLQKCNGNNFPKTIQPTRLYSLNVDVSLINETQYNKLTTPEKIYETKYKNKKSKTYADKMKIPEQLKLRVGSQVMVTKNIDPDNNIINGTRGVVIAMEDTQIKIELMNHKEYLITPVKITSQDEPNIEVQYIPLKLAWAITIHKSQGLTIDCAEMDLGESIFQSGQAYTALSRVKDLNSVRIVELCKKSFKTHPEIKQFYQSLVKTDYE